MYNCVIKLIEKINIIYRTPQEFEYFYKAQYGSIKMSIILDKDCLTDERKQIYYEKLNILRNEIVNYDRVLSFEKLYGRNGWTQDIYSLMSEKMSKIQNWITELIDDYL